MRIANVSDRLVIVVGDRAVDVEMASKGLFSSAPQDVYERWDEFVDWALNAVLPEGVQFDARGASAPVPLPRQVFAIGLNYSEHAAEGGNDNPTFPPTFTKFPTSLTGAHAEVELPTETVDWEAELVVVIGRRAHRVPERDAWKHVAGLTVGQDLSERTSQLRPPVPQFSLGKSFPGFSPTGPWVITVDEVDHPDDLAIGCGIEGEVLQRSRTSMMIFSIPALIEKLSSVCPLLPGDLIFTGTPSGVGVARTPKRFLKPGDVLVTTVEGVGTLSTQFRALAVVDGPPTLRGAVV